MDLDLRDKVVLVAAASQGLGAAIALEFGREGASVIICSRDKERIEARADLIRQDSGTDVLPIAADVTRASDVERLVEDAVCFRGHLDILVTNAGGPRPGRFLELSPEDFETACQLTLMSVVRMCYGVVPYMLAQGGGSIVTITSLSVKQPIENLVLSNTLRLGVIGLTKTLANELGPNGIRVNSVLPGWTRTSRVQELLADRAASNGTSVSEEAERIAGSFPLGRMADPREVARTTVFLASPAASYVHGVALPVDGGAIRSAL
jgi:3-oxoacyl-[acyl-carrier protein] reductase